MSTINVTTGQLTAAAERIRTYNAAAAEALGSFGRDMEILLSQWESPGASQIHENFGNARNRFRSYVEAINDYAKFLDNTASTFTDTERDIREGASAVHF